MTSFDIAKFQASIDGAQFYTGKGIDFLTNTTWMPRDDYDVLYDNEGYAPVICNVVGRVSPNRMFIEPHGDFIPPGKLEDASLRFSLVEPQLQYPRLQEDFQVSIQSLKTLVDTLCDDAVSDSFLSEHQGNHVLTFMQPIFSRSWLDPWGEGVIVSSLEDTDMLLPAVLPRDAIRLPVRSRFFSYLEPLAGRYQYNYIRVFSSSEPRASAPIWIYKNTFQESLVQVNFGLQYHPVTGLTPRVREVKILVPGSEE